MESHCILCNGLMDVASLGVPQQEDPDLVCTGCRTLSPDERAALRVQAMARLLGPDDGR